MELMISILEKLGQAAVGLLTQPFYYISIIFVILLVRRQLFFERKLFHSRLHSLLGTSTRMVLWGLLAGLLTSLLMLFVGASVQPQAVIYMWAAALILALIRVRFACFAYSIGLLGIVHAILVFYPELTNDANWGPWLNPLADLHMSSLLALVGIMHIVEAVLIRLQGTGLSTPLFLEGKRGKPVGAFQLQGFWPVPLLLLVPAGGVGQAALPFTPLFGGSIWGGGWMFAALPIVIGFTDMTASRFPQHKSRQTSLHLTYYGISVIALAIVAEYVPVLILLSSILTILLHEIVIWYGRWEENKCSPIYVHSERGLTVLGIVPGSPAHELGILSGEIIRKVNGQRVRTKEELHQALRQNSAFSKLEIMDQNGEVKFVQRPIFAGEHHQLGIILAPDDDAQFYVRTQRIHLFNLLRNSLRTRNPVEKEQ